MFFLVWINSYNEVFGWNLFELPGLRYSSSLWLLILLVFVLPKDYSIVAGAITVPYSIYYFFILL